MQNVHHKDMHSVTVPPPMPDRFSIGCLLQPDRSKQPIEKQSGVGGGTVTLRYALHGIHFIFRSRSWENDRS